LAARYRAHPPTASGTDFRASSFTVWIEWYAATCTFLQHSRYYEAPPPLVGETIEARFDPLDPAMVEIYFQGQMQGVARFVNPSSMISCLRPNHPKRRNPSPPASPSSICS
jgi:hypothetical protein